MTSQQVVFFNEKLIKAYHDKDLQMKIPKFNLGFQIFCYMIKRGLVFLQKNIWKHRRRILSKVFNFQFIASQIPVMVQSADMMFNRFEEEYWSQHSEERKDRKIKISLYELIAKYTSSIIMTGFLGMDSMKEQLKGKTIQEQILKLTDQSIKFSRDPLNLMFGQKFLKLGLRKVDRDFMAYNKQVNQILMSFVEKERQQRKKKQHLKNRQFKNIIELILQQIQTQNKSEDKEIQAITDDDLIDDIKTFIIAGTDTTSNYLSMLLLYIYEHPDVLERLRRQISEHFKSDEDITLVNIKKIKYFEFVLAETGFQRVLQQDALISDIPLKKGTCLNLYTRPLFNNPKIFKDPLAFNPERWEAQTEENKHLLQLSSFQIYGGPRGYIGKHLAITQTKVGTIKFLRRYKNLIRPQRNNRRFEFEHTVHIANSQVHLQRYI